MGRNNVGILGGGQLARMLVLAGTPLGLRFTVYDPAPDACAGDVAKHIQADFTDSTSLNQFCASVDVLTAEFENVPVEALTACGAKCIPAAPAFAVAQDRLEEKNLFRSLGIVTPKFAEISKMDDVERAINTVGLPAILKTRRLGYDGKGQTVIRSAAGAALAVKTLGGKHLILEEMIRFERELSVIAVRSVAGEMRFYPIGENRHAEGILRECSVPAPNLAAPLQAAAEEISRKIAESLSYVGVLAVELFEREGELLANEIAPRVHNTGHWTIEGAETSQFENHLRAILGLPLGATGLRAPCKMENIIGVLPDLEMVLRRPGTHLHLYGKKPAQGRKLGHITYL